MQCNFIHNLTVQQTNEETMSSSGMKAVENLSESPETFWKTTSALNKPGLYHSSGLSQPLQVVVEVFCQIVIVFPTNIVVISWFQ